VPLGIAEDAAWEQARVQLRPGSLLLVYTDGIQDAQSPNGEFFGEERMARAIQANLQRPVVDLQDGLLSEVYTFASGEPQMDDITLMVVARDYD
jgi:sigma-B regulation protein RsbU (phosphoserine phosphatase)